MGKSLFSSSNNKYNNHKLKRYLYIVLITIILSIIIYLFISYNILLNNFKTSFNKNDFTKANSILITKGNINPVKKLSLKKDLNKYFNSLVKSIPNKINNNSITKNQAINILSEINRYNFVSVDTSSLQELLQYEDPFEYGLSLYNSEQYLEAYNVFLTVPTSSTKYDDSINYIKNCKDNIKSKLIQEVDALCINNYYTKALNTISEYNYIFEKDKDIISKRKSIENQKSQFLAKQNGDVVETSTNIINNISISNINTLSIDSLTNYLIHVDLAAQKTYIYNGSTNKWNLEKTFSCSTGVIGSETPTGLYTIKEKGNWFFSEKYNQGAKYWVQFSGNYLFHSLPYNKDQSEIVDYTLGKPSSHGCIRLSVPDSKWLYDNIPANTKVIIK